MATASALGAVKGRIPAPSAEPIRTGEAHLRDICLFLGNYFFGGTLQSHVLHNSVFTDSYHQNVSNTYLLNSKFKKESFEERKALKQSVHKT
jgi:hypothetical protein